MGVSIAKRCLVESVRAHRKAVKFDKAGVLRGHLTRVYGAVMSGLTYNPHPFGLEIGGGGGGGLANNGGGFGYVGPPIQSTAWQHPQTSFVGDNGLYNNQSWEANYEVKLT